MSASLDLRWILGHYPTGVCVVTGRCEARAARGIVIGSFTSVSLDPPLIGFCVKRGSSTWALLASTGHFCINVLAEDQEGACRRIFEKANADPFAGIPTHLSADGLPVLSDAVAFLDCATEAVHEAGDHFIVIGRVRDSGTLRDAHPLIFLRGAYGGFSRSSRAA